MRVLHISSLLFLLVISIFVQLWTSTARAQLDPASSLLVKPSEEETIKPNLDSGRYTVRQPPTSRATKSEKEPNKIEELKVKIREKVEEVKNQRQAENQNKSEPAVAPSSVLPTDQTLQDDENRNVLRDIRDAILGGDPDSIMKYKDQLHPEDTRQNIMNISVSPSYLYVNSSSSYWYRNYHSSGPGISVDAEIWLTPFVGITGEYITSLVADVNNEPATGRSVLADHRMTNTGIQFRKYTSLSKKSPWFNFGIKYSEYQMIVPKADPGRIRLNTRGIDFSLETHLPTSNTSDWFFGTQLLPKIKTREEHTAVQAKSGNNPTGYAIQMNFGQDFSFDRHNQVFWRFSHRLDKTVYEGAATLADPKSGTIPQGVSVTTGITMLEVGYTWGD